MLKLVALFIGLILMCFSIQKPVSKFDKALFGNEKACSKRVAVNSLLLVNTNRNPHSLSNELVVEKSYQIIKTFVCGKLNPQVEGRDTIYSPSLGYVDFYYKKTYADSCYEHIKEGARKGMARQNSLSSNPGWFWFFKPGKVVCL